MKELLLFFFCSIFSTSILAQCDPLFEAPLSPRIANYKIDLRLDHTAKKIKAFESLEWINTSTDTLSELRLYMYLNAFKNTKSSFISEAGGVVFGQDLSIRKPETFGWINIDSIGSEKGGELTEKLTYIQPDDDNIHDQSVLQVPLKVPLLPGDTLNLRMHFTAKMPKIIARAGYSKDDYFLFVHWFPQAGVYEQDVEGNWAWNCHQFHQGTEFYSDFGNYEVSITASDHLTIGASGCLMKETKNGDGTNTLTYAVEDVIDFAWVCYSDFDVYEDQWEHVNIRLLAPPEHCTVAPRYITAIKQSLEYLTEHVGPYPYPTITIVDPPLHGLRSGMMEYPTLITVATFHRVPRRMHNMESLAVHEFVHQYFMGMVASNEKEEAWMDEGLVTYYEDRIIDHYYGEKTGYFDLYGYRTGNKEMSRLEYTGLRNPKVGITARPGWEIKESYKGLVYAKTSTMLHTLEAMLGQEVMDELMSTYFERWKFKHPKGHHFFEVVNEVVRKHYGDTFGENMDWFFEQVLFDTKICDYSVGNISNNKQLSGHGLFDDPQEGLVSKKGERQDVWNSRVSIYRLGEMIFPQEIEIAFEDGTVKMIQWDGKDRTQYYDFQGDSRIISVHVDPQQKIWLDVDLNNNSLCLETKKSSLRKYTAIAIFWVQNIFQSVGMLM